MRRIIRSIKQLKLTILIILSVIIMSVVGICFKISGKATGKYGWKHPFIVSALLGEKDVPPLSETAMTADDNADSGNSSDIAEASVTDASEADALYKGDPSQYPGKMIREMQYEEIPEFTPRSPYYESVNRKPLSTTYPYLEVDDEYFKDTLFIGDSRIEGLHDYGQIENADFCYKDGINVFNICDEYLIWGEKGGGTLDELLTKNEYNKIYISLGINELGKGYASEYANQYNKVINYIRNRQKSAIITIIGIMYVTKSYSDSSDVFNNDNINCRNCLIAEKINGINTIYLDINPAVTDDAGALKEEYSNDGIHLTAEYYELITNYLKQHGLSEEMWQ